MDIENVSRASRTLARKDLTDSEKLYIVFQEYKQGLIDGQMHNLYYALLAWADTHNDEIKRIKGGVIHW